MFFFFGPGFGVIYLQRLSADATSRHRVKSDMTHIRGLGGGEVLKLLFSKKKLGHLITYDKTFA